MTPQLPPLQPEISLWTCIFTWLRWIFTNSLPLGIYFWQLHGQVLLTQRLLRPAKAETQQALFHNILCDRPPGSQWEHCPHNNPSSELSSLAQAAPWTFTYRTIPGMPRHCDTPALPNSNHAKCSTPLRAGVPGSTLPSSGKTWITPVFPREQRSTSFPAREDGNQLRKVATTTAMVIHWRHL